MSAIKFDIQKFDDAPISAGDRLGWTLSLPKRIEETIIWEGEKASKYEGRNLAGVRWESLDGYSVLLGKRSVRWVFYRENMAPRSDGYGDATATYIRMAMVPSGMYAKHQYNTIQGSKCGNTWCYTF